MLKGIKRIINKIPEAARVTFENTKYNPDKKVRADPTSLPRQNMKKKECKRNQHPQLQKNQDPTLQLPEAKMAARPDSTAYRNPNQEVIPSETLIQNQFGGSGANLEEEQVRMALERSRKEIFDNPTETADASAASGSPSLQSTPPAPQQSGDQPSKSKE